MTSYTYNGLNVLLTEPTATPAFNILGLSFERLKEGGLLRVTRFSQWLPLYLLFTLPILDFTSTFIVDLLQEVVKEGGCHAVKTPSS